MHDEVEEGEWIEGVWEEMGIEVVGGGGGGVQNTVDQMEERMGMEEGRKEVELSIATR